MEWAHMLLFLVVSVLHSCADAQAVTISNPPLGITLKDNLKATMSVMLVAFLSAFVFMGFFSLYLRHCSYGYGAAASNNSPIATAADLCRKGFNREVIDKCPVLSYSSVKDLKIGKGSLECAVCLTEFHDYDNIRLLPKCHHVFHPDCIDAWLLSHMNCPVCRTTLTPPDVASDHIAIPIPDPSATPPDSGHEMEQPEEEEEGQSSSSNVTTVITAEGEADSVAQEVVIVPVARESRMLDKLPRSHSTGHSLGEKVRAVDRYTLRLPDHVRRHILANQGIINRRLVPTSTSSDHNNRVVLPGAWSSKTACYRSSNHNSLERWSLSVSSSSSSTGTLFYRNYENENFFGTETTTCWTPLRVPFYRVQQGAQQQQQNSLACSSGLV